MTERKAVLTPTASGVEHERRNRQTATQRNATRTCFSSHSGMSGQTSWLGAPNSSSGGRMKSLAPLGPGQPGGLGASPTGRHRSRRWSAASSHCALDNDEPSAFCTRTRHTIRYDTIRYANGEVTSQNLRLRYDHHFVGITWHRVWS